MHPASFPPCCRRLGVSLLLAVAGALTIAFNLRVAGFLVVVAGFGVAGYGLARAIVPARTTLDRLLVAITFAVAVLAVVAEALSLAGVLGDPKGRIIAAGICGIVGGLLPIRDGAGGRVTGWRAGTGAKRAADGSGQDRAGRAAAERTGSAQSETGDDGVGRTGARHDASGSEGAGHDASGSEEAGHADVGRDESRTYGRGNVGVRSIAPPRYVGPSGYLALLADGRPADRITRAGTALAGLLVVAAGVHLATVFLLSWFAGITVGDTITHYLPRSIRFAQS